MAVAAARRGARCDDGGALAMKRGPNGEPVVVVGSDNKTVFLSGTRTPGANWETQAPRPWVDKLDFETRPALARVRQPGRCVRRIRHARSTTTTSQYIYTHESPTIIPDAYLRDTKTGTSKQLTQQQGRRARSDAVRSTSASRSRVRATASSSGSTSRCRATGVRARKLPGIIWFYPREYTSQADYDRSRYTTNINKFPDLAPARPASSTKLWVTQGYALIEPDSPIMGDSGKMNDNYTRDLKENLDAVIDAVVDAGYVDRNKMGIGGHSYGAFSTVNALTLTPYFKAGIAGDGMYNRSLTPFGFQSERRDFFEAQDDVPRHVAVLPGGQDLRRAADVPRARGSERRHGADQLRAHVPRAAGTRQAGGAVHVSVRGSQRRDVRDAISICGRGGSRGSIST